MVLEFLRAEIGSIIGQDADLSDPQDNSKRALVLDCLRGYSRRIWLFSKFPTDTAWKRVKLTPEDFPSLRYVRSSLWRQLAGDDLSVVIGAKRIVEGTFDKTYREIARRGRLKPLPRPSATGPICHRLFWRQPAANRWSWRAIIA
jgi:hypothetical protein